MSAAWISLLFPVSLHKKEKNEHFLVWVRDYLLI